MADDTTTEAAATKPADGPAYWEHIFEDELIPMVLQAGTPDRVRQCLRVVVEALFRRNDDGPRRREFLNLVETAIKDQGSAESQKETVVYILRATKDMRKERARAAETADGDRRSEAPAAPPEIVPEVVPEAAANDSPAESQPADDDAPAAFHTQLVEAIADHMAERLAVLACDPPQDRRPPFFLHPGAAQALRNEIRHHLGPAMLDNRRIRTWADQVSREALADGTVATYPTAPGTGPNLSALWRRVWEQLLEDLNARKAASDKNPGQKKPERKQEGSFLSRWFGGGGKTRETEEPPAGPQHDPAPAQKCWARLTDDGQPWLPLTRDDVEVLTALFDTDPEHLKRTLRGGGQILAQEADGEAVEGRSAGYLGDLVERNTTAVADVLMAHLYLQYRKAFQHADGRILTGFLRGLGQKREVRRDTLPRFHRWFGDELPV